MKTLNLVQGSEEWKAIRELHCVASEAPIIMGCSPYVSRDELLSMKSTGDEEEITRWKQKIFNKGHEVEELARPIAEDRMGEELFPAIGVRDVGELKMLASFDGINMLGNRSWECKQFNKELFDLVESGGELTGKHYWQLEHQLLVSEADHAIFCCTDGTEENYADLVYTSDPDRREQLIHGWMLFLEDLKNFTPAPAVVSVEGKKPSDLPVLKVEVSGAVSASNLDQYKSTALEIIEAINTDLSTDQDFADAEKAIKWCSEVEGKLASAQEQVLSQAADINDVIKTLDELSEATRSKRLSINTLVKDRKKAIRNEIAKEAREAWLNHLNSINDELKRVRLPSITIDIAGAMKSKRTIATLRSSANDEVARAKIEANRIAAAIKENLAEFDEVKSDYAFLFNDLQELCTKDKDAFAAIVKLRIAEHEAAEKARIDAEVQRKVESQTKDKPAAETGTVMPRSVSGLSVSAISKTRPTDEELIGTIAVAYSVHESKAIEWLLDMDLTEASEKLAANF